MVEAKWTTLDGVAALTRDEILDACEVLDAIEEAAYLSREKAKSKEKAGR